jgi:hypothetical protein
VPVVAWCLVLLVAVEVKPQLLELVQELVMMPELVLELLVVALPPTLRQCSMLQPRLYQLLLDQHQYHGLAFGLTQ